MFNVNDGFTEGLVRGLRTGFLGPEDYRRLSSADNMEDIRSALEDTDYGSFMQDEPSPIQVATLTMKCRQKLADEFRFLRSQSVGDLSKFLDFIAAEKMIDNIVALIQGTINNKPPQELLLKTDPIGDFPEMKTIPSMDITAGYDDIYKTILIDTPVGPYFEEFLKAVGSSEESAKSMGEIGSILTETDLEIMKQSLKKAWLEDFYRFTQTLGGSTAEVCGHILKMEADFRVLLVTLNALNTPLGSATQLQDRNALYPNFGYMYPEGTDKIRKAWNETTVRAALEPYIKYLQLFDQVKSFYDKEKRSESSQRFTSLEDLLYVENVNLYELAFEQQYHFGVFYAWVKLREQEIRNLEWIANMVIMNKKDHVDDIVPIFQARN